LDPLTAAVVIGAAAGAINAAMNGGGVAEIANGAMIGGGAALVAIGGPQGLIAAALAGAAIGASAEIITQMATGIAEGGGLPRIDQSKVIAGAIAGAVGAMGGKQAIKVGWPEASAERIASEIASLLNMVGGIAGRMAEAGQTLRPCE